jgi:HlyD family secretion protein
VTRRRKILVAAAVLVIGVPTVAVILGWRITSPSQQAADAVPPRPSLITSPVIRRVLRQSVVASGTARAATTVPINALLSATGGSPAPIPVVSAVGLTVGQTVEPGSVLVVISGRPVIALQGAVPAYRNLQPGSTGPDVTQLQAALSQLGYYTAGDPSGTFGLDTEDAVRDLYAAKGYSVPLTSPNFEYALSNALRALQVAQQNLALFTGKSKEVIASDQNAIAAAQATYDHLLDTGGAMVPRSEVAFIPQLPAVVTQSRATMGDVLGKKKSKTPLMTVSAGAITVSETVPAAEISFVHVGDVASIAPSNGNTVSGKVFAVGTSPVSSHSVSGFTVLIGGSALSTSLVGQSLQVTITSGATAGPVLAVPASAIFSTSSGLLHVSKVLKGGQTEAVAVKVGISADGLVQVTAIDHGVLVRGNQVVVGSSYSPSKKS